MIAASDLRLLATKQRYAVGVETAHERLLLECATALEAKDTELTLLRADVLQAQREIEHLRIDLAAYQEARAGLLEYIQAARAAGRG